MKVSRKEVSIFVHTDVSLGKKPAQITTVDIQTLNKSAEVRQSYEIIPAVGTKYCRDHLHQQIYDSSNQFCFPIPKQYVF